MELISMPGLGPNPANVNGCIMEQGMQILYLPPTLCKYVFYRSSCNFRKEKKSKVSVVRQ